MGIITETLTKALINELKALGIDTRESKPESDNIDVNGTRSKVMATIEPDVELMPGWTISILESDIHIRVKGDPEDTRFPLQELTIPFADPKAIEKTVDRAKSVPIIDSSSHIGIIEMEVPDDDIENEKLWKFTVIEGKHVKTNDDGTQEIVPSDVFITGAKIEPHKPKK